MKTCFAWGLLAVFCGTFWAPPASAQSRLFPTNQSGFSLAAGLSAAEDVNSLGAAMAMTAKSRFDLGVSVSRLTFDSGVLGGDGVGVEIRPIASFTVVRPAKARDMGVELTAGYAKSVYNSDGFINEGWLQGRDALNVGANFYFRLRGSPTLIVYPGFSVDYVRFDLDGGRSVAEDNGEMAYGFDVTFLFTNNMFVTPSYRSLGGEKALGLSVGVLIPGT